MRSIIRKDAQRRCKVYIFELKTQLDNNHDTLTQLTMPLAGGGTGEHPKVPSSSLCAPQGSLSSHSVSFRPPPTSVWAFYLSYSITLGK